MEINRFEDVLIVDNAKKIHGAFLTTILLEHPSILLAQMGDTKEDPFGDEILRVLGENMSNALRTAS